MQQLADKYKYMYYCINQICISVDKNDYKTFNAFNSRLQSVIEKYSFNCKDSDREDFLNAISWAQSKIDACKDKITRQGYNDIMNDGRRFI